MSPKTWLAAVTAVASLLVGFLDDGQLSLHEWILIGGSFAIAVQMYVVPNLDASIAKYAKGVTAFVTAVFAVLIVVLPGGVDTSEWLQVALAGLAAVGVPLLPAPQFPAVPSVPNEPNPRV